MSQAQIQMDREAGWDVRVAVIGLVIFFGCMILLPRDWFFFYAAPMFLFWWRYINVRDKRDAALSQIVASAESSAGCYPLDGGGICIDDGTTQLVIGTNPPKIISAAEAPNHRLGKADRLRLEAPRGQR